MKLVLHIGPHKTGSTSIQNSLQRGQEALARQGVLYHTPDTMPIMGLVLRFAHDRLLESPGVRAQFPRPRAAREWSRAFWKDLADTVTASDAHTCVVSSEHFAFFPAEAAEKTVAAFREIFDDITLVAYARAPDSLYTSGLQQRVASGIRLAALGTPGSKPYPLRGQIDAFASQMAPGKVRIRSFDRANLVGGDVVRDFLSLIDSDTPIDIPSVSSNESLSGAAVAWLLGVNETWDRGKLTPERERIMGILRGSDRINALPKLKLTDAEVNAAILARASDDITYINDRYLAGQTPLPTAPEGTDMSVLKSWTKMRVRDWIMSYLTTEAMQIIAEEIMDPFPNRDKAAGKGKTKHKRKADA
ncbi:hypothetical protein [Mesobacterium pallidum]|uniref:hypothetical protein n=1 Tax=Mesobacterium pallidum TaxID=2872037 RepID=UPI001EE37FB9|nr:hypothetical protein [Mesobacterium pallidum]